VIFRIGLLIFGVVACSSSVLFIKASHTQAILLSGLRLLLAAAALSPLLIRDLRRHPGGFRRPQLLATIVAGALLGVHFITWILGARGTAGANASLIVNMVPVAMPLFLLALTRERLTGSEIVGTAIAVCGVILLGGADLQLSREHFRGDVVCFVSMLLFCGYLALGRKNRGFATIWLYVVPLYLAGGLVCLAAGAASEAISPSGAIAFDARELTMILGLGIVPTVIGHSILNYSMKHLRGQVVGVLNVFQFVSAGVLMFLVLGELPAATFYPASVLVLIGTLVVLRRR